MNKGINILSGTETVRNLHCLLPFVHDSCSCYYLLISPPNIITFESLFYEFQVVFTVSSFAGNSVYYYIKTNVQGGRRLWLLPSPSRGTTLTSISTSYLLYCLRRLVTVADWTKYLLSKLWLVGIISNMSDVLV